MSDHPFFQLKTAQDFQKQDNIMQIKPVYTKKVMHNVSKPTHSEYFKESEFCFTHCEPKHKKADNKFQDCLRTCLKKWTAIHEYRSKPEFCDIFLPKRIK